MNYLAQLNRHVFSFICHMITFKQFLVEGGKATAKYGTTRANKQDIEQALKVVSDAIGISVSTLTDRLLGSTRLTYGGFQKDSGDIDLAILDSEVDKEETVQKMIKSTGVEPYEIGGNTFSFAVPVKNKKVQVDLMFVPDLKWAKFSHFASENSKHKSGVRNELIHSALKWSMQPGKDIRVKDKNGQDLARASMSFKLDTGAERIFKIAPKKKQGVGRVKGTKKASPQEVQQTLDELGLDTKFSHDNGLIRNPDKFAELLFGKGSHASDLDTAENLIKLIKSKKSKYADEIFADAVRGMKSRNFKVPDELAQYE